MFEPLGESGLLLHLVVVGPLLIDDVPARKLFLTDVDRGCWLVSVDDFVEQVDVAGSVALDSVDEASVSHSTKANRLMSANSNSLKKLLNNSYLKKS